MGAHFRPGEDNMERERQTPLSWWRSSWEDRQWANQTKPKHKTGWLRIANRAMEELERDDEAELKNETQSASEEHGGHCRQKGQQVQTCPWERARWVSHRRSVEAGRGRSKEITFWSKGMRRDECLLSRKIHRPRFPCFPCHPGRRMENGEEVKRVRLGDDYRCPGKVKVAQIVIMNASRALTLLKAIFFHELFILDEF